MYDGPILDAFLHTPWLGDEDPAASRGDHADWNGDPRLQRVMRTFHHLGPDGVEVPGKSQAEILGEMDLGHVDGAVLAAKVYYHASRAGVESVHQQLAALAEGPAAGRLKVVATIVPPELGPGTYWDVLQNSRLIEDAHRRHGIIGVHITPSPWGLPPSHKWFYPLYAKCVELGLCLYTYVGIPGPLWPMDHNNPGHLDEVALAFPDLTIIAHHIGDPWNDIVVRLAARHTNFYICTSAWYPKAYPIQLVDFMRGKWHGTHGSEKVLFASDWPILDLQRTVTAARELPLSDTQAQAFLYGNAKRLLWGQG